MSKKFSLYKDLACQGYSAVFIDDSGSPGLETTVNTLHSSRKTWAAVVINNAQLRDICVQMPQAISLLGGEYDVQEFHFAEIYGGKGSYKGVSLSKRLDLFSFMATIFQTYRFPIVVQTLSDEFVQSQPTLQSNLEIGPLKLENHQDLSLLLLIRQVENYLRSHFDEYFDKCCLFIDEGRFKAGHALRLTPVFDFFYESSLFFDDSVNMFPLQLADFAAYCINRQQVIVTKEKMTDLDITMLNIMETADFNCVNLKRRYMNPETWSKEEYDHIMNEHRREKGLPEL